MSSTGGVNDQDTFRSLLRERVTLVPHLFNKTEWWGSKVHKSISREGRLHHYVGPVKPWHLSMEKRKIASMQAVRGHNGSTVNST